MSQAVPYLCETCFLRIRKTYVLIDRVFSMTFVAFVVVLVDAIHGV